METTLNEDVLKKAQSFLDGEWKDYMDLFPTIEALSIHLDKSKKTIERWAYSTHDHEIKKDERHAKFAEIVDRIRALQALKLIKNGLNNSYNPFIAKLLLTKHGYSDKIETENRHDVKAEVGASQAVIDKVAQIKERIMNANKTTTE